MCLISRTFLVYESAIRKNGTPFDKLRVSGEWRFPLVVSLSNHGLASTTVTVNLLTELTIQDTSILCSKIEKQLSAH